LIEILEGPVIYIPKRPGEPDVTHADITKISAKLNWEPKVSFKEGVAIMLENISAWEKAPLWDPNGIAEATETWFRFMNK